MLLRTSISKTKKLLQKTIGSFKSLFSKETYEKLPKNPQCPSFSHCNLTESREFYKPTSIKHLMDNDSGNKNQEIHSRNLESRRQEEARRKNPYCPSTGSQEFHKQSFVKHLTGNDPEKSHKQSNRMNQEMIPSNKLESRRKEEETKAKNDPRVTHVIQVYTGRKYDQKLIIPKEERVKRRFWVTKMLNELEMFDRSNEDHVMDLEEILHYYSRLTYPAFVDIVERYLIDLHSQLFTGNWATSGDGDSSPPVFNDFVRFK